MLKCKLLLEHDSGTFVHATLQTNGFRNIWFWMVVWNPERGRREHGWILEEWNQLEIGDEIIFQ